MYDLDALRQIHALVEQESQAAGREGVVQRDDRARPLEAGGLGEHAGRQTRARKIGKLRDETAVDQHEPDIADPLAGR